MPGPPSPRGQAPCIIRLRPASLPILPGLLMLLATVAFAEPLRVPPPGASVRLIGDADVRATLSRRGMYRIEGTDFALSAPLPAGYPAPTPPGAMELKTYPSVRRAEIDSEGSAGMAMMTSFYPLYRHISSRDIPMTSPVEVDLRPGDDGDPLALPRSGQARWTVSFLYRTPDEGALGADGRVRVVDTVPVTVVSAGLSSPFSEKVATLGLERIQGWLAGQPAWEVAGEPRALAYSGPGDRPWTEVQVPVRPKGKR